MRQKEARGAMEAASWWWLQGPRIGGPRGQGVGGGRGSSSPSQGCRDQIRTPAKGKRGRKDVYKSPRGRKPGRLPQAQRTMGT